MIQIVAVYSCTKNADRVTINNGVVPTGTAFYVDGTNGRDGNSGKSISSAWKTIQKSAVSAPAGSLILIRAGVYKEQVVVGISGTAASPVTFKNYNNETVVLDGSNFKAGTMLSVTDKSYLTFNGLIIQNLTGNGVQGVLVDATKTGGASNLTFRHLTIQNISWTGTAATVPTEADNAQAFIVYGHGQNESNAVSRIILDSSAIRNNITGFSEAISLDGNIDGFSVSNNFVHDNSNIGIAAQGNYGTSANSLLDQARNGLITGNTCFNNIAAYATSGGIYVDGGKSISIERNISYQNGTGIEVGNEQNGSASLITVVANVLYLNQEAGLAIGGYTTQTDGQVLNSTVHNNTFFQNNTLLDGTGELVITKATGCVFENNVFCTNGQNLLYTMTPILPQTGNIFGYNSWFTNAADSTNLQVNYQNITFSSFATYRQSTKQDQHSLFAAPAFVNAPANFRLLPSSPCINKGDISAVRDPAETDITGKFLITNGKTSMGAYQ